MNAAEVISNLKGRGVKLWREGDVLRYRARLGALTDKEKAILKMHKPAILRALAAGPDNPIATVNRAPPAAAMAVTRLSSRANTNRRAMPIIASVVDQFRRVFGDDQVKIIFAEKGDLRLGTAPATSEEGRP